MPALLYFPLKYLSDKKNMMGLKSWLGIIFIGAMVWLASCGQSGSVAGKGKPERIVMLNVSYDPTREFYRE